mgnify:CR=1 FL=1
MQNRSVLSIDLGSAYTKLAIRRDWHDESDLLRHLPLATSDVDFCIPSVVARVENAGATRWLTGAEAASRPPGEDVTIYRYWKARLFAEHPEEQATHDSLGRSGEGHDLDDYEEVAVQFFRGLRTTLQQEPFGLEHALEQEKALLGRAAELVLDQHVRAGHQFLERLAPAFALAGRSGLRRTSHQGEVTNAANVFFDARGLSELGSEPAEKSLFGTHEPHVLFEGERIEKTGSVAWAADNRTFFYTIEDHAKRHYRLYRHVLGTAGEDELVYEESDERFNIGVERSRSRRYSCTAISCRAT